MVQILVLKLLRNAVPALIGAAAAFVATQYPHLYAMVCDSQAAGSL